MDYCIYHLDSDYNKHLKNELFENAITSFRERLLSERKVGKGLARWLIIIMEQSSFKSSKISESRI